jgi:hypothetical protein
MIHAAFLPAERARWEQPQPQEAQSEPNTSQYVCVPRSLADYSSPRRTAQKIAINDGPLDHDVNLTLVPHELRPEFQES